MVSLCRGWSSSSLRTACVFLSRGLPSCSELLSLTVREPVCFGLPSQGIVGFYDYEKSAVERLLKECKEDPDVPESAVHGFTSSSSLLSSFAEDKFKVLVLSLPHGSVVDSVIEEIAPHMKEGDVVIDCGNEWWENTERRQKKVRPSRSFFSLLDFDPIRILTLSTSPFALISFRWPRRASLGSAVESVEVTRPLDEVLR